MQRVQSILSRQCLSQFLFIAIASVLPTAALASIDVISTRDISFKPAADCRADNSCGLKSARFVEYKKRVLLPGDAAKYAFMMTDTRFVIDAEKPENIENFAMVQFIRGCVFEATLTANGRVEKEIAVYRHHFGLLVPFQHKDWVVDIDNQDPLYSSYEESGRWALLRWNKNPADLTPESATYYANAHPRHGTTFLTDLPAPAVLRTDSGDKRAQGVSLEFKSCLFRVEDVPVKLADPRALNIDLTKALWCADWDHKFAWDFKKQKLLATTGIDPVCEVATPQRP
jgi:hypothetical protein